MLITGHPHTFGAAIPCCCGFVSTITPGSIARLLALSTTTQHRPLTKP